MQLKMNLFNPKTKTDEFHALDEHIKFMEEEHKYFVRNENYISCTTFIKEFFNPFDQIGISENCVRKKRPLISNEDLKIESAKLRQTWTQASNDGTKMHLTFENYYNFGTIVDTKEMKPFLVFAKNMELNGFLPYRSEWAVYDSLHRLAGTIDQLFYKKDDPNVLYMYDWKRSKNVTSYSYGKKGKILNFMLNDCNFVHYALQQNLYKYILETNYGKKVKEIYLFVVSPKTYKSSLIHLPDMQNEIKSMLIYKEIIDTADMFDTFDF